MKHIRNAFPLFILSLVGLLLLCVLISVCCGHYSISARASLRILFSALVKPIDYQNSMDTIIIFGLRLPRILGAILVGSALSLAGATYQSIFQNPLVSPDILGASSGACVGAAFGILMHIPKTAVVLLSFGTGILTVIIAMIIPKLLKSTSNLILVLSGIIAGGIMDSIMGIIKYVADPQSELPQIIYWTMGALDNVTYEELLIALIPVVLCALILYRMVWWIDILSFGETDAKTVGADTKKIKTIAIVSSTLLTAIAVCLCGTIGWLGLVVPHFSRLLVGADNSRVFPTSVLLGSIFLILTDTAARTIAPVEVPLGIITGFIGAPFYAWLLYCQHGQLK